MTDGALMKARVRFCLSPEVHYFQVQDDPLAVIPEEGDGQSSGSNLIAGDPAFLVQAQPYVESALAKEMRRRESEALEMLW